MKINSPLVERVIAFVIIFTIIFNISTAVCGNKYDVFSSNYWSRYDKLKKTYYDSIYGNKKGQFIRDELVYSFAAGSLIRGVSPILVNPETPPLGKYFIALSVLFFNNEHITTILFGVASLVLLYLLGRQVLSSTLLSLLPVLLLSFDRLFLNQFVYTPLLDIVQLFFLLAFFIFFNKSENNKNYTIYFLIANLMLGGFISVKFFGSGVTLFGAALIVLLLRKQYHKTIIYLITFITAPITLLSMYIPVLLKGYSIKGFLGIQKWIFLYNSGHLTKYFTFFPLFLMNKWYSWWDQSILSDSQWRITWPISMVTLQLTSWIHIKYLKSRNKGLDIVLVWTVLYILLLQVGYVSSRYFVILLPELFLIMVYLFRILVMKFSRVK